MRLIEFVIDYATVDGRIDRGKLHDFDWLRLSCNPSINLNDILENEDLPWDIEKLCMNPSIPLSYLMSDSRIVSRNEKTHKLAFKYTSYSLALSWHPEMTLKIALSHPYVVWDWRAFSYYSDITIGFVLKNKGRDWDWSILSSNPAIKLSDILEYPELPWRWYWVSQNPSISVKDMLEHPELPWSVLASPLNPSIHISEIFEKFHLFNGFNCMNFMNIVYNPTITVGYLVKYFSGLDSVSDRDSNWDWEVLSSHRNITYKDIISHPELPWDAYGVSKNPNLTVNEILSYCGERVDWYHLSRNPHLTVQDILEHPHIIDSLDWCEVSANSNLKLADIVAHPELPWRFQYLSMSTCGFDASRHRIQERNSIIKEDLVKTVWHPNRIQRLLDRGYDMDDLFDETCCGSL